MTVNNVIIYFFLVYFNLKFIYPQITNGESRSKNVIDLHDGSGNGHENVNHHLNAKLLTLDDEDSMKTTNSKILQSSGDGQPEPPDMYPTLHPYAKSRSTATIIVDIAIESDFKSYMLPGSPFSSDLNAFYKKVIRNLQEELSQINVDLGFKIISLRPGPLISKRHSIKAPEAHSPSVFARINVTQYNSSIVNPMIIFHISHCGRLGILGNLTISDQVIFPLYVCPNDHVYCLPNCRKGTYCDGIVDCPSSNLDEAPSCPKCLYKTLQLTSNTEYLNEGENLVLSCNLKESCNELQNKIEWSFPGQLEKYQIRFRGERWINSLPKNKISSGIYKCHLDEESAIKNITVFKRPDVFITNTVSNAVELIMTESYGSDINLWCNCSEGHAQWNNVESTNGYVNQMDREHSKLIIRSLSETTDVKCQVRWGFEERGNIMTSVRINVVCNPATHFQCKRFSGKMCIPISQKCDSITQCEDSSDEEECNYCSDKSLSISSGQNVFKERGDTLTMTCSSTMEACYPLIWLRFNKPLEMHRNLVVFKQSVFVFNISSIDTGIYRCSASSNKAFIDVSVNVIEPPTLKINYPSSVINITAGHDIDIICSITENKAAEKQTLRPIWKFDQSKMILNNIKLNYFPNRTSILSMVKATKDVESEYTCEVLWGLGYSKKSSITVRVNVIPLTCSYREKMCADKMKCIPSSMWCDGQKQCHDGSDEEVCNKCRNGFVIVQPSTLVILSRESTQVTCYYHKDCYPVEWRLAKDQQSVNSINGVSVMGNKLMLNNVGLEASKVYECFSGDKSSQINITVIEEVNITFIGNPGFVFVDHGGDIEVNCHSNYGEPRWSKTNFKSIEEITGAKQTYIQPNIAQLTIKSATYDARGYYNCSVRSPDSNRELARKLMFIHVHDLTCPEDNIKCDKNTKCIPKHKLCDNVMDCRDNSDEKNCTKCNFELEIKPKFILLSTAGWGNLQCIVPHKDCLPIQWITRNGDNLSPKNYIKYNHSLFMFNLEPQENQEIICTNGQKSTSAFLTVKYLDITIVPYQPDGSTLYINKGDTQIIECRSTLGTPQWIFPRLNLLSNFGVRYLTDEPNVAKILLTNVQENASGLYVCSVAFTRETKKKSLSIKVI